MESGRHCCFEQRWGKQQQTSHLIIPSENRVHRILIFARSKPFHLKASDLTNEVVFSSALLRSPHINENQAQPPGRQRRRRRRT